MLKEWVKDARNEARLTDSLYVETGKSLATAEGRNKELALKLVVVDKDRRSTEAGLRTAGRKQRSSAKNSTTRR